MDKDSKLVFKALPDGSLDKARFIRIHCQSVQSYHQIKHTPLRAQTFRSSWDVQGNKDLKNMPPG